MERLQKITKKFRRINSNYREWKAAQLDGLLYFNKTKSELMSRSLLIFTELDKEFHDANRIKHIPEEILKSCTLPHFLATLYIDGSYLSISYRVNHNFRIIYLTTHIYLYLQSFSKSDLELLRNHIIEHFKVNWTLSKRKDGFRYVLKTTTVDETFKFLLAIRPVILTCPSTLYKK